jgi:hypothetical protein
MMIFPRLTDASYLGIRLQQYPVVFKVISRSGFWLMSAGFSRDLRARIAVEKWKPFGKASPLTGFQTRFAETLIFKG